MLYRRGGHIILEKWGGHIGEVGMQMLYWRGREVILERWEVILERWEVIILERWEVILERWEVISRTCGGECILEGIALFTTYRSIHVRQG